MCADGVNAGQHSHVAAAELVAAVHSFRGVPGVPASVPCGVRRSRKCDKRAGLCRHPLMHHLAHASCGPSAAPCADASGWRLVLIVTAAAQPSPGWSRGAVCRHGPGLRNRASTGLLWRLTVYSHTCTSDAGKTAQSYCLRSLASWCGTMHLKVTQRSWPAAALVYDACLACSAAGPVRST